MARRLALVAAALGAACASTAVPPEAFCEVPPEPGAGLAPFVEQRYIAHAGGSPYGLLQREHYTNSREAFEISYANGFRAFELDLVLLADGAVVVAHDWHEDEYGLPVGSFPELTRSEVEGRRWRGKYEVMLDEDLIELMVEYPDVWIILDTKLNHHVEIAEALVALAPDDSVRDRMVPHLASDEHVTALAEVYPFPERMVAVYRWAAGDGALIDAMARHGIDNIMMWHDSRWSEATQEALDAAGVNVWVHTPAEPALLQNFVGRGVGVYSNGWLPCPEP
jgi:glycerophosphoryl diester phosphodiesterase